MELRATVTDFVRDKIKAMRAQATSGATTPAADQAGLPKAPGSYQNISVLRANSMKFMPNFFGRHQLRALFFCFPDPHFKARKHKMRIVSSGLVAEYAYVLRPGGVVYTITDVCDLHEWMVEHFDECSLFERLLIKRGDEVVEKGELSEEESMCVELMTNETEEGKKVTRNSGTKYVGCFKRREDPEWPE
jgi:tRNA (guanine-N7-)-methyltransferase